MWAMLTAPAEIGERLITEIPSIALPAATWERSKPKGNRYYDTTLLIG
jgi:hypothetical protein